MSRSEKIFAIVFVIISLGITITVMIVDWDYLTTLGIVQVIILSFFFLLTIGTIKYIWYLFDYKTIKERVIGKLNIGILYRAAVCGIILLIVFGLFKLTIEEKPTIAKGILENFEDQLVEPKEVGDPPFIKYNLFSIDNSIDNITASITFVLSTEYRELIFEKFQSSLDTTNQINVQTIAYSYLKSFVTDKSQFLNDSLIIELKKHDLEYKDLNNTRISMFTKDDYLKMAMRLYETNNFHSAAYYFEKAGDEPIKNIKTYFYRGYAFSKINYDFQAIDSYKIFINKTTNKNHLAIAYNNLATINEKNDDEDKADSLYNKAIENNPNYIIAYNNLAYNLERKCKKNLPKAINNINIALRNNPKNVFYLNTKSLILIAQKKIKEAKVVLKKAIEINPNYLETYNNLAYLYSTRTNEDSLHKGLKFIDHALESKPNEVDYINTKGVILANLKKIQEARENYEKAYKINPVYKRTCNNIAYFLAEQNENLDRAFKLVNIALEKNQDCSFTLDTKGWIYYKKKDYVNAKKCFQKAIDNNPEIIGIEIIKSHLDSANVALKSKK